MLSVRPKVAELVFQLYEKPLHPELFDVFAQRRVERGSYCATVQITSAGHVITWRCGGVTLCEVAASAHQVLPQRKRLFSHRLKGQRSEQVDLRRGISYQSSFQLEPVDPEVFWTFQEELRQDGQHEGLLYHFRSSGRMSLGAISYIHVETRNRLFLVQAFHTFPDDYAIVKSQSLFEIGQ